MPMHVATLCWQPQRGQYAWEVCAGNSKQPKNCSDVLRPRRKLIQPSGLDFSQFGIVVRSKAWPVKVGGALPNTQVFTSEREQLDLAISNAFPQLGPR